MILEAKTPQANIGVIIGRFQTPYLHQGHTDLIDSVCSRHKKIMILLGCTNGILVTRNNPLDYHTRMIMLRESYPDVVVMPVYDTVSDYDWSEVVDSRISEAFGLGTAVLYGSRDAFIPHYYGKYPTVELEETYKSSATAIRNSVSDEVRSNSEFRRGIVYAAHNKHPVSFQVVDLGVFRLPSDGPMYLALGRKKSDLPGDWRLPGGFVDPSDKTLESAAIREGREELGINCGLSPATYVGSFRINDYRYRSEVDGMMSALFYAIFMHGSIKASDDLDEVKWFDVNELEKDDSCVMEDHQPLIKRLITYLKKKYPNYDK